MGSLFCLLFKFYPASLADSRWYNTTVENDPTPILETTVEPTPQPAQQHLPAPIWTGLVLIAFVLGLGAGYLIWARPQEARANAAEQKVAAAEATAVVNQTAAASGADSAVPEQVKRYDVPVDDDPVLGNPKAPITIIEFSDYQCPYCQQWNQQVLSKIESTYGDKIRLVYRDFPLESIHPEAFPAAEAANCAGEQDKYFDYHNLLFSGALQLGRSTYEAYAKQLKLDMTGFTKCLDEHRYKTEVQNDLDYAANLGVRSTPTFFINGLAVVGAQPFEVFQQVIDLELAGKIPQ